MNEHHGTDLAVPVSAIDHVIGAAHASVTVVEYGDFECPNFKQAAPAVKLLLERFESRLRVVFRHFPLEEVHPHALSAALAAEAAGAQGHFWEMEDLLSGDQSIDSIERASALAGQLGLDVARFETHVRDRAFRSIAAADAADADRLNVRGTPTFFVGDERVDGLVSFDALKDVVERHLRSAGGR